jgi:indole-3-glycerol phosphate synthase
METPSILEELSETSYRAAMERREAAPEMELVELARRRIDREGCFERALAGEGLAVIAEYKQASPSEGDIRIVRPEEVAEWYASAAAISVLTEETRFGGSLEQLSALRELTELPLLRKDFITHPYQVLESGAAGADAVLLIASTLDAAELQSLRLYAEDLGMEALVEVHDRADLERAVESGAKVIGINNRDLRADDHPVDTGLTGRLLDGVPEGVTVVTESGFDVTTPSRQRLRRYNARGVDAVLIGTGLMRHKDPAAAVRLLSELGTSRRSIDRPNAH